MKKYLRLIIEIVLGLLLVGAGAFGYMNFAGKKHISHELTEVAESLDEAKEELAKTSEELREAEAKVKELSAKARELEAVKAAFANGVLLGDVEGIYKGLKTGLSAERQLSLGAIRLLTNGAKDPETVSAFNKALEMADWSSRLNAVCAAQNALVAAGEKITVLADCAPGKADEKHAKDSHGGAPHWDYEGEMGPENWGKEFPTCAAGKKQSPLNIVGPFEKSKDNLEVSYKPGPLRMLNNGHTIQVNIPPGSSTKINGEVYDLLQFHFHRPSEEKIDGKPMAMVAHFVHKSKAGKLAVIGVLLKEGKDNEAINVLWDNAPAKEGPEVKLDKISFDPGKLIPAALTHYAYEGSLTTPPCSEGVNFYILKTPVDISKAQVAKFPFKMNARPVQPLNGRKISAN
jgi:carbonic anhydrase